MITSPARTAAPVAPAWRDVLLAVGVAVASIAALWLSDETGARAADGLALLLLILLAVALLGRRRWPTMVVVVVSGLALVSFALGYPGGPPTVALLVALYSVAAAGHRWWSVAITVVFAGGGLLYRAVVEDDPPVTIVLDSALFVLVSLLGDAVHSRRQLAGETRERLRLVEAEREAETQRRVTEERLRIARELHDVMAHTVTTMSVQAGAALDSLDRDPEQTRGALATMRSAGRQAMQELRATVSLLRADPDGDDRTRQPAPGLDHLDDLIAGVEHAGIEVERHTVGIATRLPPALELTAYRAIQEGLTNVIRHAQASTVQLRLIHEPNRLVIQIDDDGVGIGDLGADGFGLRGLRERTDAVGGSLELGPAPSGGSRLRVQLPKPEASA